MASGVVTGLALDAIEKAAPVIVGALAPEIQKLLASIPSNTVKVVPPAIDVEVAVAANLMRAMPAFSAGIYATVKSKIGIAVAIYATEHPGDPLESDAAWMDIQSMAVAAIAEEGLDTYEDSGEYFAADGCVGRGAASRRRRGPRPDGEQMRATAIVPLPVREGVRG